MHPPFTLPPLEPAVLDALTRRLEETTQIDTYLRYQMVWLAHQGYAVPQIARQVRCSRDTVLRVLHRFAQGGLDAVPHRKAPGRVRQVNAAWEAELARVIELDPHTVAVASANWTTRLLAEYLAAKTGVKVSLETVRVALHRLGYVCKRPTWTLKRQAQAQADWAGNA